MNRIWCLARATYQNWHSSWLCQDLCWNFCEKTLSKHNAELIKKYNRTAHALSPLCKGNTVSIQNPNSHWWDIAGQIVGMLPNHQYRIRIAGSGRITLQNRRFLRKLKAPIIETTILSALPVSTELTIIDMGRPHQSAKRTRKWWHYVAKWPGIPGPDSITTIKNQDFLGTISTTSVQSARQ